jgi:hypothetical protein
VSPYTKGQDEAVPGELSPSPHQVLFTFREDREEGRLMRRTQGIITLVVVVCAALLRGPRQGPGLLQ